MHGCTACCYHAGCLPSKGTLGQGTVRPISYMKTCRVAQRSGERFAEQLVPDVPDFLVDRCMHAYVLSSWQQMVYQPIAAVQHSSPDSHQLQ